MCGYRAYEVVTLYDTTYILMLASEFEPRWREGEPDGKEK